MSPQQRPTESVHAFIAPLLAVYVIWGSTFLAIRLAIATLPPLLMCAVRHGSAGLILLAVALVRGERAPSLREACSAVLLAFLILVVGNGGVSYAEQWVPSSLAAMLFASIPILASLAGGLFGRWPRRGEWTALAIGVAGVALLSAQGAATSGRGLGLVVAGVVGTALGVVLTPRLPRAPGLMGVAAQLLSAGVMLAFAAIGHGDRAPDRGELTAASLGALVYLVIFGSVVAYAAYSHLLAVAPPAIATSNNLVNPVVAAVLGATLGGEPLGATSVAGMVLILVALALLTRGRAVRVDARAPGERAVEPVASRRAA